jgi:hypothetical protein
MTLFATQAFVIVAMGCLGITTLLYANHLN